MTTMTPTSAADLKPGDTYTHPGADTDEPITVTIISQQMPATDFFGRSGHFRYWAKRSDTDKQGYVTFGPGGAVLDHRPAA